MINWVLDRACRPLGNTLIDIFRGGKEGVIQVLLRHGASGI